MRQYAPVVRFVNGKITVFASTTPIAGEVSYVSMRLSSVAVARRDLSGRREAKVVAANAGASTAVRGGELGVARLSNNGANVSSAQFDSQL